MAIDTGNTFPDTELDSPEISFSPASLGLIAPDSGSVTANLFLTNEIINTEWSVGISKITQVRVEKYYEDNTTCTFHIDTSRVTENEFAQIEVTALVRYRISNGNERTAEYSKTFRCSVKEPMTDPEIPDSGGTVTPIETSIEFTPSTATFSAGTSAIVTSKLTTSKLLDSATWTVAKVQETGVVLTLKQDNLYNTTLTIDASSLTGATTGDVKYSVSYKYTNENNESVSKTEDFTYKYNILEKEIIVDSTPVLSFNPQSISINGIQQKSVNLSVSMEREQIVSTEWDAVLGNSQLLYSISTGTTATATLNLDSSYVLIDESGNITVTASVLYNSLDGTQKKQNVSGVIPYTVIAPIIVDSTPEISIEPISVTVYEGTKGYITANVSMTEVIESTSWGVNFSSSETKLENLKIYAINQNPLTTTIEFDATNVDINDEYFEGHFTVVAQVTYIRLNGLEGSQRVSKSFTYRVYDAETEPDIPENPDPEPEIPTPELVALPRNLIFTGSTNTLTINSNVDMNGGWDYFLNDVLTVTVSSSKKRQVVYDVNTRNVDSGDRVNTTLIIRGYLTEDKSEYVDIEIDVLIRGKGIFPVWEDNFIQFDSSLGNRVQYKIIDTSNNNVLYAGRVNKLPNGDTVAVDVSKIVGNYLNNSFPEYLSTGVSIYNLTGYSKTVDIIAGDNNTVMDSVTIFNSWAYSELPYSNIISDPIRKVVDRKQYFICSMFNPTSSSKNIQYKLKYKNNSATRASLTVTKNRQVLLSDGGLSSFQGYNQIDIDGLVYDIVDGCYEYCLYYCNAYGGYDSLLVGGNSKKTDKITSQYYKQSFDNKTRQFEKTKYLNVISQSFVLYTDYFNDDEQSRLHHLLESTEVYLHNLNTNEILPVNITNTSCDYTTFTNNGKKKWYNTINVDVAQEKIRK